MKEEKTVNRLLEALKKDKVRNIVVLAGICGIILIYLSTFISRGKEAEALPEEGGYAVSDYEADLTDKLRRVVSAITGEESPEIMVTLDRETEYVYAADEKSVLKENFSGDVTKESETNHDTERSYIILKDANGNQHALTVTEIKPEIKGVVVVSKAAGDSLTQEKIINAVKTALGISSARICVVAQYG